MSIDERGIQGHLSIEKARVWDLKTTGQVRHVIEQWGARPADPTLCVVTVQGSLSVLSFYNAHSGGKMSTVRLQNVVAAAQFTKDGNQIVVILRDWTIMMLRPGSPVWSKSIVPFKKDTKPAEHLLLTLSPAELPVIYFTPVGQQRINVAFSAVPSSRSSLLSSSQKTSFTTKLTTAGIMGIACHPDEVDVLFAMISDGTIQAFSLDQTTLKRFFSIGEANQVLYSQFGQFDVLPHPFVNGAALILAASAMELLIFASHGRAHNILIDSLPLKGIKRVSGLGIHKEARVFLVFGELADGTLSCIGARYTGSEAAGTQAFFPECTSSATDVMVPNRSVGGVVNVMDRGSGSWMELWDAVPAWAQTSFHAGSAHPRIRTVKVHSVMGAIAAQTVATGTGMGPHVLLWSISDAAHPLGGSHTGLVVPQHTPLSLWAGRTAGEQYKLEFPHHCYFLSGNKLSGYGLRSKAVTDIVPFNPPNGRAGPAMAETLVFSTWQRTWLIFFRSFTEDDRSRGIEEWTFTIQREDEVGTAPPWFKPGVSGVFTGPKDEHFCVLDPDLFTVHVFPTRTVSKKDAPLLSLMLPSPGLLTPAIFQGPPISQIPKPPPPPEYTQSGSLVEILEQEEEADEKSGYGVIIWVNKFRQIAMGNIMSTADGSPSMYDSDAAEFIQGGTFNELTEGEIMIHVSWQILSEEENADRLPNSFTAAVLTNQRLMLFLANGYPVLSFPPQNSPGLYSPPMSCLWVGPALLYVTRSGEVNQLLWDGSTVMICGAPSTTGSAVLAAALGDRILFLCRETASQSWQVATRHAIIGYALLMGWASLASSGLMPPAWVHAHARTQMKIVVQHFDVSTVSAPVTRALVQSDFADVAHIIASRWPKEAQKIKVACSVAAKNWAEAAEGLMDEHRSSVYYPGPIPKGSSMWKRFYSVAMGAVQHGSAEIGAQLFAAAGEWEWALVFLSLSSNISKMSDVTQTAGRFLDHAALSKLLSLSEQLRKRAMLNASAGALLTQESNLEDLSSWTFAAPGYLAPMFCIQGDSPQGMIKDGDVGVIDPLETTDIEGYVSGASKRATGGKFMRRTITMSLSGRSFSLALGSSLPGVVPESFGATGSELDLFANPQAQTSKPEASQDPHGFSDIPFDEKFSSDEEESPGKALERSSTFSKKFKIQIKKKEDSHTNTSSEALREAAKNLRLGGHHATPSLGPSGFAAAMKGSSGMERAESVSSSSTQSHLDSTKMSPGLSPDASPDLFAKPKTSGSFPISLPPPPTLSDPFGGGDPFAQAAASVGDSFKSGVQEMEGGNWQAAIRAFSKPGVLSVPKAKQYLAAVLLLKERAFLSGAEAARMDRYAAAMDLEAKHKKQMTLQAISENMVLRNYAYAKQRLEWLIETSLGQISASVMTSMQKQLDECTLHGAADEDISPFENLGSVSARVESAKSVEELKLTIDGLAF